MLSESVAVFQFPYMKHQYRQNNRQSKTIEEFNRQCAEERAKQQPESGKKYQKRVHNYVIDTQNILGSGTFSSVYKGKDVQKGKEVAVKVIELRTIQKMGIKDLFWEELNIIQRLRHPNIVVCLEYFRTPNNCYTIYEFCEGGDLSSIISKGPLGEKEDLHKANNFIKDIFQGLLYLETMSIVHRDIKAANILINRGKAKIGDFGFATRCKSQFRDASIGSPAYMSPEGLLSNIYGPKTDVWAFGILVFQLLHGFSPFHHCENEEELKEQIVIPVSWDQLKTTLPSPLKRMILKCLKVKVEERPTFTDLLTDEYIQKLYQFSPPTKSYDKSNYSKNTADSEKIFQSVSLSVIPSEKPAEQVHIEEHSGKITIVKIRSLQKHFSLLFDEDTMDGQDVTPAVCMKKSNQQKLNQQNPFEKVNINHFGLVPEEISNVEELIAAWKLFVGTFKEIESIEDNEIAVGRFKNIVNQLSSELYYRCKEKECLEVEEIMKIYSEASLKLEQNEVFEPLSKEKIQTVFSLIKTLQNLIDKQDLSSFKQKNPSKDLNLVHCGNSLILCYRFLNLISKNHSFSELISTSKTKDLNSSEQFYIWLYEIELQEMELEGQ